MDRVAYKEFGTLMGVGCCDEDYYIITRAASIMAMWEKNMKKLVPEDQKPITMVMYCAALLPTGIK